MFTAVAVLQLIEAGKLDFNARVAAFLGLKDTALPEDVTVFHLLTMTSGIADGFAESGDPEANWTALVREHPLWLCHVNLL